jgi:hypothetical protein
MDRRKLLKSLSGGAFAIWGGSLLGPSVFAQASKTTTTTTNTTAPTAPKVPPTTPTTTPAASSTGDT